MAGAAADGIRHGSLADPEDDHIEGQDRLKA
jgi:hypothetical protein